MKGKYNGRFGVRRSKVWDGGRVLGVIRKEFGEGNDESRKVAELKKLEKGEKIIEEFVQEFRRIVRESGYVKGSLVKEFKRGTNKKVWWRLIEVEY